MAVATERAKLEPGSDEGLIAEAPKDEDPGKRGRDTASLLDGVARGVVGAMAMTGARRVSVGLGLLEETPPKKMAEDATLFRLLIAKTPRDKREEIIELGHWFYGALGGLSYALLVPPRRQRRWTGPAYGLSTWLVFELGLVPLLGLSHGERNTVSSRLLAAADHLLYGIVLSAGRR